MMVLQGVSVVTTVIGCSIAVLGMLFTLGGFVWKLSSNLAGLKSEIELLKKDLKGQAEHYEQKMDKVDSEIKHTLETLTLKLRYSEEADKRIEQQIGIAISDMKTLSTSITKIESSVMVAQALAQYQQQQGKG